MRISPITKEQLKKIAKAALYLAVSSAIAGVLALITEDPRVFGFATPFINVALVTIKQAFTVEGQ